MFGISAPWSADFFPQEVWNLMTNLGLFVAVVALLSALWWLWQRGPGLLIKHGPQWMTTLGHWWSGKRG